MDSINECVSLHRIIIMNVPENGDGSMYAICTRQFYLNNRIRRCFLFTPALCTSVGNVYSTSIKLSIQ